MSLSQQQVEALLRPINPRRVLKDGKGFAHVSQQDIRAALTRYFGFGGWQTDVVSLDSIHQEQNERGGWAVTYRCVLKLTIRDPHGAFLTSFEDVGTGTSPNLPKLGDAHDFAAKVAVSIALKRAATNLGDCFGLSLYNKGQTSALVIDTLVKPEGEGEDVQDIVPEQVSMGHDDDGSHETSPEADVSPRQVSSPPTSDQAGGQPAPGENPTVALPDDALVDALRERVIAALELSGQKALIELGRVGIEVSKNRLAKAETTTPDGKRTVTMEVLLDGAMKVAGRKPHGTGNPHADAAAGEAVAS